MLAVMDWNNQNRQTVENRGSQNFDQVYSKRRKSWVLRKHYRRNNADVLGPALNSSSSDNDAGIIPCEHVQRNESTLGGVLATADWMTYAGKN